MIGSSRDSGLPIGVSWRQFAVKEKRPPTAVANSMYVDHFGDAAEMGDRADGIAAGSVAALFASHDGITCREIDPDIFVRIGQGITRKDPAVPAQLSGFQVVLRINPGQFLEFPICQFGAAGRFGCGFGGRTASGSET
jgi:hypothetical protein